MLLVFGGYIPYFFGCYLTLYEDFWRLIKSLREFSLVVFLKSLFFIIGGYLVVSGIHKLTEFQRKIDRGEIQIED